MVKLTRILKTEYRDDVASKRNRRNSKKKSSRDSDRESQTLSSRSVKRDSSLRTDISQATGPKEVNLPPALLKIIKSHAPGHSPSSTDEEREQVEPPVPNPSSSNPHHFALTRAAQMALRTMPMPADADERSQSSTMALIDSIVKTSDDPALIDALQAMMVEANGQSAEQRETLALVAESIMEKKAAKEALQRAVLAESRLHESLKKCAPELVGDAAAMVAVAEMDSINTDTNSTPVTSNGASGFFHRINRSFTAGSQNGHRRMPFGKSKSKSRRSRGKSKSDKKTAKDAPLKPDPSESSTLIDDSILKRDGSTVAGEVGRPTEEPVAVNSFVGSAHRFAPTQEEEEELDAEERRDDQEQAHEGRQTIVSRGTGEGSNLPKRKNKYKHITSVEPETSLRFKRSTSNRSKKHDKAADQSTFVSALGQSTFTTGNNFALSAATESEIEVITSIEEAEDGTFVEVDEESDSDSEGSEDDEDNNETEGEVDDPTISNFEEEEAEKIEYTIFELESKVSMSTYASSFVSGTSGGTRTSHSEDHEEDGEATDNDTLEELEGEEEEGEEGTADEATFNDDEDGTLNEGEETGESYDVTCSEDEEEEEEEEQEEEEDDDDDLLFLSFCQRPDSSSFEADAQSEEETERERRHRRRRQRRERREEQDIPSILKCVSGYFTGGDDVEVFIEDEHRRRRRRRRRQRKHRS